VLGAIEPVPVGEVALGVAAGFDLSGMAGDGTGLGAVWLSTERADSSLSAPTA